MPAAEFRARIHRGAAQVGCSCVELEFDGCRLVLDVGCRCGEVLTATCASDQRLRLGIDWRQSAALDILYLGALAESTSLDEAYRWMREEALSSLVKHLGFTHHPPGIGR